jgi:hypothetical protein
MAKWELNTTLMPHNIIHGDACFAYFTKIWGIPGAAHCESNTRMGSGMK